VFRKKGEGLLKRIAKYYGLTIEITGQIDVPEGFAVESSTGRDLHSHVISSNLLQLQADAEANKASSSKTKQTQHPGKHAAAEANGKKSANEPPPASETSTKGRKGKQGKQKPDSESTPNNAKQGTGSQPAKMDSQATASNESIPVGIVVGDGPANKVFICWVARFCVVMESATFVSSFTICFRNRELYLKTRLWQPDQRQLPPASLKFGTNLPLHLHRLHTQAPRQARKQRRVSLNCPFPSQWHLLTSLRRSRRKTQGPHRRLVMPRSLCWASGPKPATAVLAVALLLMELTLRRHIKSLQVSRVLVVSWHDEHFYR
jgi:hypothetical protein